MREPAQPGAAPRALSRAYKCRLEFATWKRGRPSGSLCRRGSSRKRIGSFVRLVAARSAGPHLHLIELRCRNLIIIRANLWRNLRAERKTSWRPRVRRRLSHAQRERLGSWPGQARWVRAQLASFASFQRYSSEAAANNLQIRFAQGRPTRGARLPSCASGASCARCTVAAASCNTSTRARRAAKSPAGAPFTASARPLARATGRPLGADRSG